MIRIFYRPYNPPNSVWRLLELRSIRAAREVWQALKDAGYEMESGKPS